MYTYKHTKNDSNRELIDASCSMLFISPLLLNFYIDEIFKNTNSFDLLSTLSSFYFILIILFIYNYFIEIYLIINNK